MNSYFNITRVDLQNIPRIKKRGGQIASFDLSKISQAVIKAMRATDEGNDKDADFVSRKVAKDLLKLRRASQDENFMPDVEMVQDLVEEELMLQDFVKTAKAYILYRNKRASFREEVGEVPDNVRELVEESKKYFRNTLAEFVYYRTYARWIEKEGRRETWVETVQRFMDHMQKNIGDKLTADEYREIKESILRHDAMPSMRLMQFAGTAAGATNVCAYNCSYIAPSKIRDFSEIMYVLMCGAGAGYSVESQNIQALPQVKVQANSKKLPTHKVADSKEGWADALELGMKIWYSGRDIEFDLTGLRPAGARLKTMGGKSSGPEPLRQVLEFTREKILSKQGKRLSNIDAHDIICKIGESVVAGGVRRSALISLSDLDDIEMRDAKKGQFYATQPQRSMANNSAVYNEKPSTEQFMDEWVALMKSGAGERGIFNRGGLEDTLPERRLNMIKKEKTPQWGTNPCGEIILRSKQFCNLSEVVARAEDDEESLLKKTRIAAVLGTYQSTLTDFPYLSDEWRKNCEEERLLGVSITGQWDCPKVREPEMLSKMKAEVLSINKEYAKRFGVNESACATCVKPSGNVSQVTDCSSGMHPRHSQYYIRRVRVSATDALYKMLRDQGVPCHPEVGQSMEDATTYVLEFPVKSPEGAILKNDLTALEQLEHWKTVKTNFTEHNPSVTISVGDEEWISVAHWVYKNWDIVGGLSFLPRSDHVYQLAPYEEIDEKTFDELTKKLKNVDYSKIVSYEREDELDIKAELACVSGTCEI